jgi:transcriptional regulator with XRE-family HTH domain
MTTQNFAELLRSARSAADIKVSELAKQIGIDRKQIYRYERGEKVPYDDRLLAICEALALDVNAATAARAVSIQQDANRGKSNATTRSIAAAYARSCRKQREPVPVQKHIGFCTCFGVKFSSISSLLRACLVRQGKGEKRCQSCEVLSSCGKDEEALRVCSITIMGDKS